MTARFDSSYPGVSEGVSMGGWLIVVASIVALPEGTDTGSEHGAASKQCGLYTLSVALNTFGRRVAARDLVNELGPLPPAAGGYSLGRLAESARSHGLSTRLVRTSAANLLRRPPPFACVAHVDDGQHFILILDVNSRSARIFDSQDLPRQNGISEIDLATLEHRWNGVALLISPDPLLPEEELPWSFWGQVTAVLGWCGLVAGVAILGGAFWRRAASRAS